MDPTIDTGDKINGVETPIADELAAPVITLKKGDATITSGSKVANRAADVKFEITAVEGVDFYYTVDGTDPAKTSDKYTDAAAVPAPNKDTEETVTIKAVAVKPASGEEGQEGYEAEQTSVIATASVVFQAKENAKTITMAEGSDAADVTIGGTAIGEGYPITSAAKDIEAVVTASDKMFEVMYSTDGGSTWQSAMKKGQTASKPFADRAVSYGTGTYIIPKAALSGSVSVKALYLKEITLDWQEDAGWSSVWAHSDVQRVGSGSNEHVGIWGAQYPATKEKKSNVLFVSQNTKVGLELEPVEGVEFTFTEVTYKKTGSSDQATEATISDDKKFASLEIANVEANDYTVTIKGTSTTYSRTVILDEEGEEVPMTQNAATIAPRAHYTIKALVTGDGGRIYPIEDLEVTCGADDAVAKGLVEVRKGSEAFGREGEVDEKAGTYTLKVNKEAGGKTLTVKVKGAESAVLATLTLKVSPIISKVTVAKVTGTNKDILTQTIATTASYLVTPTDKASADELAIKVTDSKNALDAGKTQLKKETNGTYTLTIATKAAEAGESVAEIAIYNKNDNPDESKVEALTTLKLNTTKPAWNEKAAPTVKLAGATDINLTLDMTLPSGASETVDGGKYYYKVTTKALDTTEKDYTADKTPRYYEASGKTTRQTVNVIAKEFGKGRSEKFDVDVELILYAKKGDSGATPTPPDTSEPGGDSGDAGTSSYNNAAVKAAEEGGGTEGGGTEGGGTEGGGTEGGGTEGGQPETPDTSDPSTIEPSKDEYVAIAKSKSVTVKNLATKSRYYADKITLKKEKAASGIYTGQEAEVATVDFGKNTTYNRDQDVTAWVKEFKDSTADAEHKITVKETDSLTVKNGKVTLTVGKEVKPGKYTLCVEQTAGDKGGTPDGSIQASATMQFTVVQGIKKIEASSQKTIFAPANKASAAAKINVVFNDGGKDSKPKTAKANYYLGFAKDNSFNEGQPDGRKALLKWVDLKNGSVTIKKGYAEAAEADKIPNNKFAVQVKAADYSDNATNTFVEYEIVESAQELGNIVLVQKEEAQSSADDVTAAGDTYKVVEANSDGKISIPHQDVAKTYVRILGADVNKESGLTDADFVKADLYTLTFSKKNDVKVNANQSLVATKVVSDVTVKALTNDGGKKKAANDGKLKFTIDYETVASAKLQIATDSNYADFGSSNTTAVTVPTGAMIKVKAVDDKNVDLLGRVVNYKVKTDGGATIVNNNGNKDNLDITLVMKKEKAVLTLMDQKGKNGVAYTITNENFKNLKAAPAVSLAKKQSLYAQYDAEQELKFVVPKWDDKKNGSGDGITKIKITAAADKASQDLYNLIKTDSKLLDYTIDKTAAKEITVIFSSTKNTGILKNATLYFDFVNDDGTTSYTQTSKAVKVSTVLLKKSYKLANKYNMSTKDAAKVKLTHTGKPTGVSEVKFEKILNANIKGEINKFSDAFGFDANNGVLSLKDPAYASKAYGEDKKAKIKGINNLIGFVVYTVKYDDGTSEKFTTQLTINIDVDKKTTINGLKTTAVPVLAAADMQPEISVITSKKVPVKLVAAAFEGNEDSNIFVIDTTNTATAYAKGIVPLKLADTSKAPTTYKKMDAVLRVLPADSYYVKAWSEIGSGSTPSTKEGEDVEAQKLQFLKDYGIELKVKIDVKDPAKTTKLVKVDSKNTKVTIAGTSYDEASKTYTTEIPYTVVVSASVKEIGTDRTVKNNNKPATPDWISFAKADSGNVIKVTIDKAKYAAAVNAGGLTTDKKNYKENGKAVDAVATVTYNATGSKPDSLKFKITPPVLDKADIDGAQEPTPEEKEITVTVVEGNVSVAKGEKKTFTAKVTEGKENQEVSGATVTWSVAAKTGNLNEGTTINETSGELTIAEAETTATIVVTATYKDAENNNKEYTGTAEVTVTEKETQEDTN